MIFVSKLLNDFQEISDWKRKQTIRENVYKRLKKSAEKKATFSFVPKRSCVKGKCAKRQLKFI